MNDLEQPAAVEPANPRALENQLELFVYDWSEGIVCHWTSCDEGLERAHTPSVATHDRPQCQIQSKRSD